MAKKKTMQPVPPREDVVIDPAVVQAECRAVGKALNVNDQGRGHRIFAEVAAAVAMGFTARIPVEGPAYLGNIPSPILEVFPRYTSHDEKSPITLADFASWRHRGWQVLSPAGNIGQRMIYIPVDPHPISVADQYRFRLQAFGEDGFYTPTFCGVTISHGVVMVPGPDCTFFNNEGRNPEFPSIPAWAGPKDVQVVDGFYNRQPLHLVGHRLYIRHVDDVDQGYCVGVVMPTCEDERRQVQGVLRAQDEGCRTLPASDLYIASCSEGKSRLVRLVRGSQVALGGVWWAEFGADDVESVMHPPIESPVEWSRTMFMDANCDDDCEPGGIITTEDCRNALLHKLQRHAYSVPAVGPQLETLCNMMRQHVSLAITTIDATGRMQRRRTDKITSYDDIVAAPIDLVGKLMDHIYEKLRTTGAPPVSEDDLGELRQIELR